MAPVFRYGKRLLFSLLVFHATLLPAQKLDIDIDGARIFNRVKRFAAEEAQGRKPNTPEFFALQQSVVDQYVHWGVEPAGDSTSFFQAVPIERSYAVSYGIPELSVGGRSFFSRYGDFTVDTQSSATGRIEAELVFAGFGISAAEKGLDEYSGLDVKGKLVVVLKGNPNDFKRETDRLAARANFKPLPGREKVNWSRESQDSTKMETAYRKGASGILFYAVETDDNPFRRYRQAVKATPFDHDFMVVSEISRTVFEWIFWQDDQMSRPDFENWLKAVRFDIKNGRSRSMPTGLNAQIKGFDRVLFRGAAFHNSHCRNIIAKITGSDPDLRDEAVVIGAHFDHLGTENGQVFNGAEDNASGSAIVVELARCFAQEKIQPRRSVYFCLWTGEEMGLIGSRYWVAHPTLPGGMEKVVTYFNMDMVGLGEQIAAPGALNFPTLWGIIQRDQDAEVLSALNPSIGGPGGSDHSAFISLGIEALALMTHGRNGHPDYHQTGDDIEKINPAILEKTAAFVLQGAVNLANERETEVLIPNRQHLFDGQRWMMKIIDPGLAAEGGWKVLEAATPKDLTDLMMERVKALRASAGQTLSRREMFMRRFGAWNTLSTGLKGLSVFEHDVHRLALARETLRIGRVDVQGDDHLWFQKGLTAAGSKGLSVLEENNVALHLVQPEVETLLAVLAHIKKPILISGFTALSDSVIAKINKANAILAIDFHPEDVEGAVDQLVALNERFAGSDNLLLNVRSVSGLDDAKQALYLALIEKGWEKEAIWAVGGAGINRGSLGNLGKLSRGRGRLRRRRR